MKNKKICLLFASASALLLSSSVLAKSDFGSYYSYGLEALSFDGKNKDGTERFQGANIAGLSLGYGYKISNNISIEMSGILPLVNDALTSLNKDTFRDYLVSDIGSPVFSDISTQDYNDEYSAKYLASVNLKLEFPLSDKFDAYLTLGYSHTNGEHRKTYNDMSTMSFVDHVPSEDPRFDLSNGVDNACLLNGVEDVCGSPVLTDILEYSDGGFTVGAGFRLYYNNDTTLSLTYKMSEMDSSISLFQLT
jgi:opacity protein-like surface antigen